MTDANGDFSVKLRGPGRSGRTFTTTEESGTLKAIATDETATDATSLQGIRGHDDVNDGRDAEARRVD